MSSPTDGPVEGGRPLLRGRVFGFPVHLDLSFVIIMGVFGYQAGDDWLLRLVLWLLITPVAVLIHELGHAFAARAAGARPEIALAGFGGVTTYTPPRELSRARSLGISLAGPGVGLFVGGLLWLLDAGIGDTLKPGSWQDIALVYGIFTSIIWSLFNLLPVLPLDGGQAMRELLPGDALARTRLAAGISIPVAALAAAGAYWYTGQIFVVLFLAFFAVSNFLTLRQLSPAAANRPAPPTPESSVVQLLWQNEPTRARQVMESLPPGEAVDLAVHGAVLALTGDKAQGHALIAQELQRRPGDANVAALLVLTQTLEHDWDGLVATLQGPVGPSVPRQVIDRAVQEARGTGREDVAGRLTLLAAERPTG